MIQDSVNNNPLFYLTNPIFISNLVVNANNEWKFHWYNDAHHHSLLVKEINQKDINATEYEFYILSHDNISNKGPKLFLSNIYLPSNLIYSKISLEMKLISIQVSLSSIIVFDIEKMKRWIIDIKASSGNAILEDGMIWSTHGGKSEDLVIVTAKGIELYKISPSRGQCKLSRYINRHSFKFWYNSTNRIILLASRKAIKSNAFLYTKKSKSTLNLSDTSNIINDRLVIEGYILNSEKTTLPILELPPPEHIPAMEIGPGIISSVSDIFQVTLYGNPYMLVRNIDKESDYISVYALNKRQIELVYILALTLTNIEKLDISVYDNLIFCHCSSLLIEEQGSVTKATRSISLMFDILSQPTTMISSSSSSLSIVKQVILPLVVPTTVVECNNNDDGFHMKKSSTQMISAGEITHPGKPNNSPNNSPNPNSNSNINTNSNITTYSEWEPVAFDKVLVSHQVTKHSYNNRKLSNDSNHSNINDFESLSFIDVEDHSDLVDHTINNRKTNDIEDRLSIVKFNTTGRSAGTSSTSLTQKYLSPNKFLDICENQCILWDIRYNLTELIKSCEEKISAKEIILFLQRRGRQYFDINNSKMPSKEIISSDELHTVDSKPNIETKVAKQLLLSKLYNGLCHHHYQAQDTNTTIQVLSDIILTIMIPYYNKSAQQQQGEIKNKVNSTELFSTIREDPLEPINSLQLFSRDITILSSAINEHITNSNKSLHTSYTLVSNIQLSTIRDCYGNLICTQSEILSHIWLPLILNNLDDIKYYTKHLTLFILCLNESLITAIPAYSILLINLLFQSQQYDEIINILQFHYLPESIELALAILELNDILQCNNTTTTTTTTSSIITTITTTDYIYQVPTQITQGGIELINQSGLDMLWKLGERITGHFTYQQP